MTPVPVYVVPRKAVESLTSTPPIPQGDLDKYLSVRPGILDDGNCDVFQENSRSITQAYTRFDLFQIVDHVESGTVVVFPPWLELFLNHDGSHIQKCLDWLAATYPGNPVIVQYNHDIDCATLPEFRDLPSNFRVLQFNTSRPTPNDIVLPFWNVETRQKWEHDTRPFQGGFIGYVGNLQVRSRMCKAFTGRWQIIDTTQSNHMLERNYLRHMRMWDFALCPRGGGLSSYRFFEALQCGCIPILFADDVALPYPNLPWGEIICRIPEKDAGNFSLIWDLIGGINVKKRRQRIAEVRQLFTLGGVQEFIHRQLRDCLE